jgi:hypothetical protein
MDRKTALKYYNMVKDKTIRERLIKNWNDNFSLNETIDEEEPIERKLYKCINC